MKFKTSEHLTVADLKSDEYKAVKEELKGYKEQDFIQDLCIYEVGSIGNKEIIKINSVEIVRNQGRIVPWVDLLAKDFDHYYEISMNVYDSNDNFTITFSRK